MEIYTNIDLLSLGFVIATIGTLGYMVHYSDRSSATGKAFLFFSLITIFWGIANYMSYQAKSAEDALLLTRIVISLAAWHAFSLFHFIYVYPRQIVALGKKYKFILIPSVTVTSILNLTPFVFSGIQTMANHGSSLVIVKPGTLVFLALIVFLTGGILFNSILHIRKAGPENRRPAIIIFFGILLTFALLAIFNFTLPTFFENTRYIPYGAAFILPIIILTSYAILRHKIFNVRVFATGLITTILSILTFFEVLFATSPELFLIKSIIFVLVLVFGVLLISVVQKEIEQREEIRKLADELAATNVELEVSNERLRILDQRKSEFVSIASHQLRTPVTAIKGYSSLLLEDAYGVLTDKIKDPISKIFFSSQRLVLMINDFLNVSKIEQGSMTYTFVPLDIKKMVTELVEDFHVVAGEKKLDLATDIPEGENFYVVADEGKIRQIISNLIDNSIKYTPKGSVRLILSKELEKGETGMIHLQIKDTGIGLSQDDIHHLFGKFTRGAEGAKVNTTGSGLGLYVAKKMMEEHKGNIWVDSEGKGKGSVFSIELPQFKGELPT